MVNLFDILVIEPLQAHLILTVGALIISIIISIPLAALCLYNKKLATIVISFANLVQAVPSFAVLAIVVPLLGIGFTPALFAIVLRALLPIIKNTIRFVLDRGIGQYKSGKYRRCRRRRR